MWWSKNRELEELRKRIMVLENPPEYSVGDIVFFTEGLGDIECIVSDVYKNYRESPFSNKDYIYYRYDILLLDGQGHKIDVRESQITTEKPKKDGN